MKTPLENPHVAQAWYQRPVWRTWASDLFRYYSQRRHYRVRFNPKLETACVNLSTRDVQLGTDITVPHSSVRHGARTLHEARLRQLEAMIAHEAGHARFSDTQPSEPLLHQLWNILEDQRIEWLMVRDHAGLKPLFTMLGDQFLREIVADGNPITGLNACLAWRWGYALRTPPTIHEPKWTEIRPLVEAAWRAPSAQDVIQIAREILALLGRKPDAPQEPLAQAVSAPSGRDPSDEPVEPAPGDTGADDAADRSTSGGDTRAEQPADDADQSKDAQPGNQPGKNAEDNHPSSPASGAGDGLEKPAQPGAGEAILEDIEVPARRIAVKLAPKEQPIRNLPSSSRGRFAFERHIAGHSRPYLDKGSPRRAKPLALTLLIDTSGSMNGKRLRCAVTAAATLARASQLSGSPFRAATFDSVHTPLTATDPDRLRDAICDLYADGGTILAPSLRWALEPHSAHHRSVVIVISDGDLQWSDADVCRQLAIQAQRERVTIVPVLIGGEASREQYEETFGRSLAIEQVSDLARTLESWIGGVANG